MRTKSHQVSYQNFFKFEKNTEYLALSLQILSNALIHFQPNSSTNISCPTRVSRITRPTNITPTN